MAIAPRAAAVPGELDSSFTSQGFNTTDVTTIKPLPDGDAYVAGSFFSYGSDLTLHGIARLNPDGSLDPSFSMDGTGLDVGDVRSVTQDVNVNATGGTFTLTFQGQTTAAIAYNATGATVVSRLEALSNIGVGEVAVNKSGTHFYVAFGGAFADPGSVPLMTADPAGLSGGASTATVQAGGSAKAVFDMEVLPDGDLVAVGTFTNYNGTARRGIVRLNPDGSLDPSLASTAGTFACGQGSKCIMGSGRPEAFEVLPDGDFLVGGMFDRYAATPNVNNVARINPDGTLDAAFNAGQPDPGASYTVWGLDVETGGTTAVIGGDFMSYNGAVNTAKLARLDVATGAAAASPLSQGTGFNGRVEDVAARADGKLLVGGTFGNYNGAGRTAVAMLQPTGLLDSTFGDPALSFWAVTVASGQDGNALAGGRFQTTTFAPQRGNPMRFLPTGVPDPNFDPGTGATQGATPAVTDVEPGPDGSVWVVGGFNTYAGVAVGGGVAKVLSLRKVGLTKAGTGAGSVTWSPTGDPCQASCTRWFDEASPVTLTATPSAGSKFTGWGGACSGTGACSFNLTEGKAVTANFAAAPSKPAVKWSSSKRKRTVTAQVTRVAGVTYSFAAKKGSQTKTGTCKVNSKTKKLDCKVKLRKGSWVASVTPKAGSLIGTPATKRFRIR